MVEQQPFKLLVLGSSPSGLTLRQSSVQAHYPVEVSTHITGDEKFMVSLVEPSPSGLT